MLQQHRIGILQSSITTYYTNKLRIQAECNKYNKSHTVYTVIFCFMFMVSVTNWFMWFIYSYFLGSFTAIGTILRLWSLLNRFYPSKNVITKSYLFFFRKASKFKSSFCTWDILFSLTSAKVFNGTDPWFKRPQTLEGNNHMLPTELWYVCLAKITYIWGDRIYEWVLHDRVNITY